MESRGGERGPGKRAGRGAHQTWNCTVSCMAPRCTGMWGALETSPPSGPKRAQEKSRRSLMLVEMAVRCRMRPICSGDTEYQASAGRILPRAEPQGTKRQHLRLQSLQGPDYPKVVVAHPDTVTPQPGHLACVRGTPCLYHCLAPR